MNKKRLLFSLLLNIILFVLEIVGTSISFSKYGLSMFEFYTVDSNVLALFSSLILIIATINCLKKKDILPIWVMGLKYTATCCLALTFIVVITILAPTYGIQGYKIMLINDEMLYHHLLCPILSIVSFVLFEANSLMNYKNSLCAMIPTILYAIIIVILNVIKVIVGPYPFLHIYEQPIYMSIFWFFIIDGGAYLLSFIIRQATKIKHIFD